jgi:hypothetical protein
MINRDVERLEEIASCVFIVVPLLIVGSCTHTCTIADWGTYSKSSPGFSTPRFCPVHKNIPLPDKNALFAGWGDTRSFAPCEIGNVYK